MKTIDWDEQDWTPPDDGEVSHEIVIEIRFEVRDATAETIAKAKAKTTTPITVTDAGPGWNATIGGSGDVYFQQTTEGPLETPTNTSE